MIGAARKDIAVIDLVASGTKSAAPKGLHAFRAALEARLSRSKIGRQAFQYGLRHMPLRFFKKLPTIIIIDVTNSCNLRCPVCPVTFAMHRLRGLMPIERFRAIIDDLGRYGHTPAIYFNFSGEPTLNKILPDMIAYASARGHD